MKLSKRQQAAVETVSPNALVIAPAGSGKTRVLTSRIAYLIENCKVSPTEILAFTFTRKAAGEIKERLEKISTDAARVLTGTMHGIALGFIYRFGVRRSTSLTVYSEWESDFLMHDVLNSLGLNKIITKTEMAETMGRYYQEGIPPQVTNKTFVAFSEFLRRCTENNSMSYGMLLIKLRDLLPEIAKHTGFKHILVDEVQDIDLLQHEIINTMCSEFGANKYMVGDINQCQPAGTMILTTKGEKPIEKLNPQKDKLKAYCKHDAMIHGGHCRSYEFSISKRWFYEGFYQTIETESEKTVSCTPNHKWNVKWSKYAKDTKWNVVYLMRQGDRYRVGWCQLFGSNGLHFSSRCRLERADAGWILGYFDNKREASLWEQIISIKFGIPTILFEVTNECQYYDEAGISFVFNQLNQLNLKAQKLLNHYQLNIEFPFYTVARRYAKRGGAQIFQIETYNLTEKFFAIPEKSDTREVKWTNIQKIHHTHTVGEWMYSLDVEKYHTYVANGLCTCNSIYEFRGAVPTYLVDHQHEFDIYHLHTNYRSDAHIVEFANKLISHNRHTIGGKMLAKDKPKSPVAIISKCDSEKAMMLYQQIRAKHPKLRIAILARNHFLLKKLSRLMKENEIEHEYIGKKTALANSEGFRRFHSFMRLLVNPFDNFAFLLARKYLNISDRQYDTMRVIATEKGLSHFQTYKKLHFPHDIFFTDPLDKPRLHAACIQEMFPDIDEDCEIVDFINNWAQSHSGGLKEYFDFLATLDIQDEIVDSDSSIVQLMSVHCAKGLEFDIVIIAGANDGVLPSSHAIKANDFEAERRLFYVAATRAEKNLIITIRPEKSKVHGKTIRNPISRFIKEGTSND